MNPHRFRWSCILASLTVLPWLGIDCSQGQESLPEPARLFTPGTTLALYLDLERSAQSGIWKNLESRLGPLQEQFRSLPQFQPQLSTPLAGIADLGTGEVAELAVVFEGQNVFKNLESEQYDPDFGVVAALRFKQNLDHQQLISQLFDEADKQTPGLRAKLEETRKRVGATDWFELPPEAFEGAKLPFPLSLAVGPGKRGSVIGLGKSESLQRFAAGQTEGRLSAGIGSTLPQRGQMWLYFPIPREIIRDLSTAGGASNPMMAEFSQGFEKVREFGLSFSFGNNAIGVELALGCADAAAASELQQGMQQFIGMLQLMASQNPSAPKLLTRLRSSTAGAALRLSTEVTSQDVELALKSSGINIPPRRAGRPGSVTAPGTAQSASAASPVHSAPAAVTLLELIPGDEQQLRYTRLRIDNRSPEPIKEIRVTFNYLDRAGRNIGKWTRRHQDPVSANLAPPQSTREIRCPTFHVPSTTDRVTMTLHEIVFADGKKWTPTP